MITLPVNVLERLITLLSIIVILLVVGNFSLLLTGKPESSALCGMAGTALGGLIGLLVNPASEKKAEGE